MPMAPKYHTLGLCGFAGAGKDTVADLLVRHAGFLKLAFAEPLKAELTEAFRVEPLLFSRPEMKTRPTSELALRNCTDKAYVNAALRKAFEADATLAVSEELERPRTPRETMQLWGTEYRREQNPHYWTTALANRVAYARSELGASHVVVTDVRFANEVVRLRNLGGLLWQVQRPGVEAGSTHASATDGSEFKPDAVVPNTGDVDRLREVVLGEYWALDAGLDHVEVRIP